MKEFTIESKVTRIECAKVKANSKSDAIKFAENNPHIKWEETHEEERSLVSII